jgi:hypothetical protein
LPLAELRLVPSFENGTAPRSTAAILEAIAFQQAWRVRASAVSATHVPVARAAERVEHGARNLAALIDEFEERLGQGQPRFIYSGVYPIDERLAKSSVALAATRPTAVLRFPGSCNQPASC